MNFNAKKKRKKNQFKILPYTVIYSLLFRAWLRHLGVSSLWSNFTLLVSHAVVSSPLETRRAWWGSLNAT